MKYGVGLKIKFILVLCVSIILAANTYAQPMEKSADKIIPTQWLKVGNTLSGTTIINVMTVDQKGAIYIGTGFGFGDPGFVYRYNKLVGWVRLPPFPQNSKIQSLAVDANGNVFAGDSYTSSVYELVKGSKQWSLLGNASPNSGIGDIKKIKIDSNGIVYALVVSGGDSAVYKINSRAAQAKWMPVVSNGDSPDGLIIGMELDADNTPYIGTQKGNIYKAINQNGVMVWQLLGGGQVPDGAYLVCMTIDLKKNIYVGTYHWNVYKLGSDARWQQSGLANSERINDMVTDTNNNLYVVTGSTGAGDVYQLSLQGWKNIGSSLDGSPIISAAIDLNNNTLFIGTYRANAYMRLYQQQ